LVFFIGKKITTLDIIYVTKNDIYFCVGTEIE